jgi:hypothetical protein
MAFKVIGAPTAPEVQVPETGLQSGLRHVARTGARVGESLLGFPGDVASLALGATRYLTGGKTPSYEQVQEYLPVRIPTSSQLQEGTEKISGGYLAPKSEYESTADEFSQFLATLMLPLKGKVPFKKALLQAGLGTAGGKAAKLLGAGELGQIGGKVGGLILGSTLGGRSTLQQLQKQNYENIFKSAENVAADASPLLKDVDKLQRIIKTRVTPASKKIQEIVIAPLSESITGNKIALEDALRIEQGINSALRSASLPTDAKKILGTVKDSLVNTIEVAGKDIPDFVSQYRDAKSLTRDLSRAYKATDLLEKVFSKNVTTALENPITKVLALGGSFAFKGLPGLVGIGATAGGIEAANAFNLIKNSPIARKTYLSMIKNSLANDALAVSRDMAKLNKIANKEYPVKEESKPAGKFKIVKMA